MSSFKIQLHQLRFSAPHGLFAEEAMTGNEFEVNISLSMKAPEKKVLSLEETINYGEVYELVKNIFSVRTDLLESLAREIAAALKMQYPHIRKSTVQIIKLHPPIMAFTGNVSVTYSTKYKSG